MRTTRVINGAACIALEHWWINGGGVPIVFVHATGFCKEVWHPIIEELAALGSSFEAVTMDQRAHGASSAGGIHPLDWWDLGADVVAALGGRRGAIGVGHSSGGAAVVMAEISDPGTFAGQLLIEPVLPGPPYRRSPDHPLADLAQRRRRWFSDRAAARDNFRDRGPFVGWDERALEGYLEGGLLAAEDGLRLACSADIEAEFYRSAGAHGAFDKLGELALPVEVMVGEHTDAFEMEFFGAIAAEIPLATIEMVPAANHFLPMQRPALVATALAHKVRDWVGDGRQ